MKQRARCNQVAFVEHALRQCVGVYAGVYPAKQAGGFGLKTAAVCQCELDGPGAGLCVTSTRALMEFQMIFARRWVCVVKAFYVGVILT